MDEILKKVRGVEDENSRLTTLSQTLTNTLEESKAKLALAGTQLQALTLASLELHKELSSQKSLAEARELEIKSMIKDQHTTAAALQAALKSLAEATARIKEQDHAFSAEVKRLSEVLLAAQAPGAGTQGAASASAMAP